MRQKSVFVNWKERKWLKVRQDFKRKCENLEMTGFSDSDEAGNIDHSKSRSGYCFNINKSSDTVSWPRKLQKCMCLPTFWRWAGRCSLLFEAVHLAVSKAIRRKNLDLQQLVDVLVDNQTCIALVKNSMNHRNPKHFALKVHFAHNLVKSKLLELNYLPTDRTTAYTFTKALRRAKVSLSWSPSREQTIHMIGILKVS